MPTHWTVSLTCSACGAKIRYEDERPDWQTEHDERQSEAVAQAAAFVAEHPCLTRELFATRFKTTDGTVLTSLPLYVGVEETAPLSGSYSTFVRAEAKPRQYVECPSCGGRAYCAG